MFDKQKHVLMWEYIANNIESEASNKAFSTIYDARRFMIDLKRTAIIKTCDVTTLPPSYCYACEDAWDRAKHENPDTPYKKRCYYCPLVGWRADKCYSWNEAGTKYEGIYYKLLEALVNKDTSEAETLAYRIAGLYTREGISYYDDEGSPVHPLYEQTTTVKMTEAGLLHIQLSEISDIYQVVVKRGNTTLAQFDHISTDEFNTKLIVSTGDVLTFSYKAAVSEYTEPVQAVITPLIGYYSTTVEIPSYEATTLRWTSTGNVTTYLNKINSLGVSIRFYLNNVQVDSTVTAGKVVLPSFSKGDTLRIVMPATVDEHTFTVTDGWYKQETVVPHTVDIKKLQFSSNVVTKPNFGIYYDDKPAAYTYVGNVVTLTTVTNKSTEIKVTYSSSSANETCTITPVPFFNSYQFTVNAYKVTKIGHNILGTEIKAIKKNSTLSSSSSDTETTLTSSVTYGDVLTIEVYNVRTEAPTFTVLNGYDKKETVFISPYESKQLIIPDNVVIGDTSLPLSLEKPYSISERIATFTSYLTVGEELTFSYYVPLGDPAPTWLLYSAKGSWEVTCGETVTTYLKYTGGYILNAKVYINDVDQGQIGTGDTLFNSLSLTLDDELKVTFEATLVEGVLKTVFITNLSAYIYNLECNYYQAHAISWVCSMGVRNYINAVAGNSTSFAVQKGNQMMPYDITDNTVELHYSLTEKDQIRIYCPNVIAGVGHNFKIIPDISKYTATMTTDKAVKRISCNTTVLTSPRMSIKLEGEDREMIYSPGIITLAAPAAGTYDITYYVNGEGESTFEPYTVLDTWEYTVPYIGYLDLEYSANAYAITVRRENEILNTIASSHTLLNNKRVEQDDVISVDYELALIAGQVPEITFTPKMAAREYKVTAGDYLVTNTIAWECTGGAEQFLTDISTDSTMFTVAHNNTTVSATAFFQQNTLIDIPTPDFIDSDTVTQNDVLVFDSDTMSIQMHLSSRSIEDVISDIKDNIISFNTTTKDLRIGIFGNSLVDCTFASDPYSSTPINSYDGMAYTGNRYPYAGAGDWVSKFATKLTTNGWNSFVVGCGRTGDRINEIYLVIRTLAPTLNIGYAIFNGGADDFNNNELNILLNRAEYKTRLNRIIAFFEEQGIIPVMLYTPQQVNVESANALLSVYQELCDEHDLLLINLNDTALGINGNIKNNSDNFHFNTTVGQDYIAQQVYEQFIARHPDNAAFFLYNASIWIANAVKNRTDTTETVEDLTALFYSILIPHKAELQPILRNETLASNIDAVVNSIKSYLKSGLENLGYTQRNDTIMGGSSSISLNLESDSEQDILSFCTYKVTDGLALSQNYVTGDELTLTVPYKENVEHSFGMSPKIVEQTVSVPLNYDCNKIICNGARIISVKDIKSGVLSYDYALKDNQINFPELINRGVTLSIKYETIRPGTFIVIPYIDGRTQAMDHFECNKIRISVVPGPIKDITINGEHMPYTRGGTTVTPDGEDYIEDLETDPDVYTFDDYLPYNCIIGVTAYNKITHFLLTLENGHTKYVVDENIVDTLFPNLTATFLAQDFSSDTSVAWFDDAAQFIANEIVDKTQVSQTQEEVYSAIRSQLTGFEQHLQNDLNNGPLTQWNYDVWWADIFKNIIKHYYDNARMTQKGLATYDNMAWFSNMEFPGYSPDPMIAKQGNQFYLFCTNHQGGNRHWVTDDFHTWEERRPGYSNGLNSWLKGLTAADYERWRIGDLKYEEKFESWQDTWAPEVWYHSNVWYMVPTNSAKKARDRHIHIATTSDLNAKFTIPVQINTPTGAIDGSFFWDASQMYVVYKDEESAKDIHIARISWQNISDNNIVLTAAGGWEGKMIEGGAVTKHNGKYYLMYSAGAFGNNSYRTGYAVSTLPNQGYARQQGTSDDEDMFLKGFEDRNEYGGRDWKKYQYATGHACYFYSTDKEMYITYHSQRGSKDDTRYCNMDLAGFDVQDRLYINGPNPYQQPLPSGCKGYYQLRNDDMTVVLNGTENTGICDGRNFMSRKTDRFVYYLKELICTFTEEKQIADIWFYSTCDDSYHEPSARYVCGRRNIQRDGLPVANFEDRQKVDIILDDTTIIPNVCLGDHCVRLGLESYGKSPVCKIQLPDDIPKCKKLTIRMVPNNDLDSVCLTDVTIIEKKAV